MRSESFAIRLEKYTGRLSVFTHIVQGVTGKIWQAGGLKECKVDKDGKWKKENPMDEDGNLQHPLPFNTELGVMEPYERALQYKGENVVQVNW